MAVESTNDDIGAGIRTGAGDRARGWQPRPDDRGFTILGPEEAAELPRDAGPAPEHFRDLNLDQIVAAVTRGREAHHLEPFLQTPVRNVAGAHWRHAVFRDLENLVVLGAVQGFAKGMQLCRARLGQEAELHYGLQKRLWHLDAAQAYAETVRTFAADLAASPAASAGFRALAGRLAALTASDDFRALEAEIAEIRGKLAEVRYETVIHGDKVTVRRYEDAPDYSAAVERTFEKFKRGAVKDYRVKFAEDRRMNHVEAVVLEFVARLFPDAFGRLDDFASRRASFVAPLVGRFEREIQFYLAWVEHMARIRRAGLAFCYPELSETDPAERSVAGFDLALAQKLAAEEKPVVTNGYELSGPERIIVVSGPNQGGKTTFARAFGQLHHLASLGLPVPGTAAKLMLVDAVLAHFEREEDLTNLRGKLEDDLVRIRAILDRATPRSAIVLNEIFNSTTLDDQVLLSTRVLEQVMAKNSLCVCVSFIDELASLGPSTVSMVSTVVPDRPAERTFRVVRRKADGLAYAMSLAEKHGLTAARLQERLPS